MDHDERRRRTVGRAIEDRLDELAISQSDAAARAGLSTRTLWELRSGVDRRYTAKTVRLVENALEWPRGTLQALLAGEPRPSGPPAEPATKAASSPEAIRQIIEAEIADLDPVDAVAMLRQVAKQVLAEHRKAQQPGARPRS